MFNNSIMPCCKIICIKFFCKFNEWFKLYFREDSQVRLQIVTKGMGTGVDTYTISSSPTRLKTTSRYAGINDLVLFRNNNKEYFEITLSEDVDFDNYRTASFVFEVDGRTFIADTASEKEVKDVYVLDPLCEMRDIDYDKLYKGKITRIEKYGAFISLNNNVWGLMRGEVSGYSVGEEVIVFVTSIKSREGKIDFAPAYVRNHIKRLQRN